MEGPPSTREKKSHRPASGKIWDGGSLGRRQTTKDNPPSYRELMAPGAGLEPAATWLTAKCSTIELARKRVLDAAWDAIGAGLSPPPGKGLAAPREAERPKGLDIIAHHCEQTLVGSTLLDLSLESGEQSAVPPMQQIISRNAKRSGKLTNKRARWHPPAILPLPDRQVVRGAHSFGKLFLGKFTS
jgi:hypothetical protein